MNKQALLWSFIFMVLLLLCFTPLVIAGLSLAIIPIVMLYVKLEKKQFIFYYVLPLLAIYAVTSLYGAGVLGTLAMLYSLFLLVPGVIMGALYKNKAQARTVLTGGTVAFLAQMLFFLLLLTLFGVKVTDEMRQFMRASLENIPAELKQIIPEHLTGQIIEMMVQLLPLYLIGIALYMTVIAHWLSRKLLVKTGEEIPSLPPAKEWMIPRSFVWYYLIALILNFIFTEPNGSLIYMMLLNVMPLLMLAFIVQAIAFFFFVADAKGWSKQTPVVIAILSVVLMVVMPGITQLFTLLGLFDIAFPIRSRLKKS